MISYYVLSILSIVLYLYSFFPISKINISTSINSPTFNDILNGTKFNLTPLEEPSIDRLILIVIDALREDFVTPENMAYLSSMSKSNGCLSSVKVESPTVTLPRIKALTTGTVPQFIDVVLNLVRVDSVGDSFLHKAVEKGKKIVFYGDDTWLKAYPGLFLRSEGTSSFFVNDFHEVDDNVTRNVYKEVEINDWDLMILHYLGLDHIGHIYGPFSTLIPRKLQEMDQIIKNIHRNIKSNNKKTLIVVTGDHGMKDSGGHGGNTYSETHVPLILNGINCLSDNIDQIDIPIVLSTLLGLKYPNGSIGKLSENLLGDLPKEKLLLFYYYNLIHLNLHLQNEKCNNSIKFHRDFLKNKNNFSFNKSLRLYKKCLSEVNKDLVKKSIEQYDSGLIISCSVLLFCLTSSFLYTFTQSSYKIKFKDSAVIYFIVFLNFLMNLNQFLSSVLCFLILSTVLYQIIIGFKYLKLNVKVIIGIILCLNIIHGVSMGSSSFIEEEHQTWYFYFSSLLLIITIKSVFDKSYKSLMNNFLILLVFRVIRKLNQTGDKWSHLPDISKFLIVEDNFNYLCTYYVCGMLLIYYFCRKISKPGVKNYFSLPILILIFVFKFNLKNNPDLGKLIWLLIILNFIQSTKTKNCIENLIITVTLISSLLLRPHNIILPPVLIFLSEIISKQLKHKETFIVAHLWLGTAMYFAQGHSNSLASIDIASGYVSLSDYFPLIVTFQVLCHTYCLPILSHLLVLRKYNDTSSWNLFILQRLWIVTVTFFISFLLRQHLFIWSVFAPKVLIESSHSIVLLIEIIIHHFVFILREFFKNKKTVNNYLFF